MKNPFILLSWENKPIPQFTEYFYQVVEYHRFEYCTIILPHERLVYPLESCMKKYFVQEQHSFFLPYICTINDYIDMLFIKYVEDANILHTSLRNYEEILLLYTVIYSHKDTLGPLYGVLHKLKPSVQYSWLYTLIQTIHDCFLENKEPKNLLIKSQRIYSEEVYATFPLLYSLYIDALDGNQYITPQYKLYKTTEYFLNNPQIFQKHFKNQSLFLFGFPTLEGAFNKLMKLLWEHVDLWVYLYTNPSLIDRTQEYGPYLHRKWIEEWGAELLCYPEIPTYQNIADSDLIHGKSIYICQYTNIHAQLQYMEQLCNEYKDKNIGVVPLDSSLVEALLYYVDTHKVNISIGFPFLHSALAQLLQSILILQETKYTNLYHKETLIELLQHQYITALLQNEDSFLAHMELFIQYIQSKAEIYLDIHSLYEQFTTEHSHTPDWNEAIFSILHTFILLWEKLHSYDDLIHIIDILTNYLQQIPTKQLSTIEQAAIACLSLRGRAYFSTVLSINAFTRYTIPLTLQDYIQRERIPFKRNEENNQHIDVIGLSQIQMLSFDILIFLEAVEGNLPHEKKEYSLIPSAIQENILGLSQKTQEAYSEEYRFFSSLHACDMIYIMYSTAGNQQIGGKTQRSRFIEKLLWMKEKYHNKPLEDSFIQRDISIKHIDPISYRQSIENIDLQTAITHRLQQGVSFSMLATYIQCPFRFIQQYVIKVPIEEQFTLNLYQRDIGTLIHKILEGFFAQYKHTTIYKEELLERKKELIDIIMCDIELHSSLPIEQRVIAYYSIPKQIEMFLYNQPECYYVEDVEKKLESRIHGFPLYGVIDRIDIIEDIYYVVDYKTGKKQPNRRALHNILRSLDEGLDYNEYLPYLQNAPLQMVFYLYLLQQNYPEVQESNAMYYFLAEYNPKKMRYLLSEEHYTNYFVNDSFSLILTEILTSLCQMTEIHCLRGIHCRYCPYQYMCI